MKRVVITRVGVIAPNGNGFEEFSQALRKGLSGLSEIDRFDASTLASRIVGQVRSFNKAESLSSYPELERIDDEKVFLGLHAFLRVAGEDPQGFEDCAINLGTSLESFIIQNLLAVSPHRFDLDTYIAGIRSNHPRPALNAVDLGRGRGDGETRGRGDDGGLRSPCLRVPVSPRLESTPLRPALTQVPLDFLGHLLKKRFGIRGPNYLNCSACVASTQAIGQSFHMIRDGRYRRMLTGGFDSMLTPLGLGGFARLGALNTDNDLQEKAIRPFDLTRNGTVLGEGAAMFLLEELESARTHNEEILGEIVGYASSIDSYRLTEPEPDGRGLQLAIEKALADARIDRDAIDYVNAHGTGTLANDRVETAVIKRVFGERAGAVPVSSVKSMIGHLIGASGAVEIAAILAMLRHGFIAPTINLQYPDPECDLDYVPNAAREGGPTVVLKNSMGFGGQNAAVVIRRFQ